jgi:hypothetical protein
MGGHRMLDTGDRRRGVPAGSVDHGDDARPLDTGWTLLRADVVWASNNQDRSARTPRAPTRLGTGPATAATVSCRWSAVQLAPWRTAVLGRFRVERRANGDASSVMAVGGQAALCCLVGRVGWGAALVPASCQAERAVMHRRGLGRTGLLPGNHPFFEVIVPSLPGFGFSSPLPENPDMNFWRVADLWHTLMTRGPRRGTEIRRSVAI